MKSAKVLTISIWAVIFAVVAYIAYILYQRAVEQVDMEEAGLIEPSGPPTSPVGGAISCSRVLRKGSKGTEVQILQAWYNDNQPSFTDEIAEDGDFGPITLAALQSMVPWTGLAPVEFSLDMFNACP